ncbi:MAG: NAD(P)-dependent methylenetetrahydromethanopterin dehydrogenase [Planctomycetia bacterium]
MPKRILIQLDCDPQPSTFDAVVAVDAGADVLLRHGGVTPDNVVPLVHGAMFTRGGGDLASTAIFVGGSDVAAAEAVYDRIRRTFFGPVRVGVMLDPAGANTTAGAAVVAAARHLPLADRVAAAERLKALVLGGTGPVGQRVARLLARKGAAVAVASRSLSRAAEVCGRIVARVSDARLQPVEMATGAAPTGGFREAVEQAELIVAAGAAGATLLDAAGRGLARKVRVLIDLNAVPPAGIDGVVAADKGKTDGGVVVYGALGVGGTKMKIHRAAIAKLFEDAAATLDAEEMLALGEGL